jgi:hypothetical protein
VSLGSKDEVPFKYMKIPSLNSEKIYESTIILTDRNLSACEMPTTAGVLGATQGPQKLWDK